MEEMLGYNFGMSEQEFEDTLRQFIRREPFVPFVVEMLNGRQFTIPAPTVAFNAGGAVYLYDGGLEHFECEEVRAMIPRPDHSRYAPDSPVNEAQPNGTTEAGMTQEHFEETLRQFMRREPFQPFVVELLDGRQIEVNHPGVAFGGGAASYLTSNYDLERFECENVRAIRLATHEIAS